MKYLQKFDNFAPIKDNILKPLTINKNIVSNIEQVQKTIRNLRNKIDGEKDPGKRSTMTHKVNDAVKLLGELQFHQRKQVAYLKENPPKD